MDKKITTGHFRTIKFSVFGCIALSLGFFVVGGSQASGNFFTDHFETYNVGDLGGQGYWENKSGCYSFQVSTSTSESGLKMISNGNNVSYCAANLKNGKGNATSTSGTMKFAFKCGVQQADNCILLFALQKFNIFYYENIFPHIWIYGNDIMLRGYTGTTTDEKRIAYNYQRGTWNYITIDYDYGESKARAKLNDGIFSDWVSLTGIDYANSIYIAGMGGGLEFLSLDTIFTTTEYTRFCGFENDCQFCNTSTTCEFHNCFWETEQEFCYSVPPPVLPSLEDCSGYGVTERILCEIKNFFYRLFVPTPQKILELKDTMALVKDKFPYNYILAIQDFISYLKDNVDESQEIGVSVLGQAGFVNMGVWNSTTTFSGTPQTVVNIIKTFFKFLIIVAFGFWCFSFLKRIFK